MSDTKHITTTITISEDIIVGTLDSAFAGGSRDWLYSGRVEKEGTDKDNAWAGHVMSGGILVLMHDKPKGGKKETALNRGMVEAALPLMARGNPYQFGLMLSEGGDATTGDVLLQFAILGAEVFG